MTGIPTYLDQVVTCPADRLEWVPDDSIDAWVVSPPFEKMRTYSANPLDLGNFQGPGFVERLVPVMHGWRRTMRATGNLFLNFMAQTIEGVLSPAAWLLRQAIAASGLHIVQELHIVKCNAMPIGDPRRLKPSVEEVIHAVKDPAAYAVFKNAIRKPSLWAHRDSRAWKYRADGADGGNFIAPALERLNRLGVKDILSLVVGDDADVLPIAKTQDQRTVHCARMADEVAQWLIAYGAPLGGVVGDNFCGSGTTLIQSKRMGRHFLGGDLNPSYVELTKNRLAQVQFGEALDAQGVIQKPMRQRRPDADNSANRGEPKPRSCPHCGTDFVPKKSWQRFCKRACHDSHHYASRKEKNHE